MTAFIILIIVALLTFALVPYLLDRYTGLSQKQTTLIGFAAVAIEVAIFYFI